MGVLTYEIILMCSTLLNNYLKHVLVILFRDHVIFFDKFCYNAYIPVDMVTNAMFGIPKMEDILIFLLFSLD